MLLLIVLVEVFVRDGYEKVAGVHVDVLSGLAQKMGGIADSGRRPSPNDLTEMLYPLTRARHFLDEYRDESGRESYHAFSDLVARYEHFVTAVDAARGTAESWEAFRPRAGDMLRSVDTAVERTRAALAESS